MSEIAAARRAPRRRAILRLAIALSMVAVVARAQEPPAADAPQLPPAVEKAAATVAAMDDAVQALDVEALGRLLAPEFTGSTRGCGPDKPRKSRQEYLATFASFVRMQPTAYRRERGQIEVKLLGDGQFAVVRSQVTDRAEWSTGSLTGTSREALFLTRVGDGYKATSLDAEMACTEMKIVGTLPAPPGG
jgi:hypothetical protein